MFFTWVTNKREREAEEESIKEREAVEDRRTMAKRKIEDRCAREQRATELDRAREAALQAHLDRITDLIGRGLPESELDAAKRSIARARTLTVLRQQPSHRRGYSAMTPTAWSGSPTEPAVAS